MQNLFVPLVVFLSLCVNVTAGSEKQEEVWSRGGREEEAHSVPARPPLPSLGLRLLPLAGLCRPHCLRPQLPPEAPGPAEPTGEHPRGPSGREHLKAGPGITALKDSLETATGFNVVCYGWLNVVYLRILNAILNVLLLGPLLSLCFGVNLTDALSCRLLPVFLSQCCNGNEPTRAGILKCNSFVIPACSYIIEVNVKSFFFKMILPYISTRVSAYLCSYAGSYWNFEGFPLQSYLKGVNINDHFEQDGISLNYSCLSHVQRGNQMFTVFPLNSTHLTVCLFLSLSQAKNHGFWIMICILHLLIIMCI